MMDFKTELNQLLMDAAAREQDFLWLLEVNRNNLPPFYDNHCIRRLSRCDLPENLKSIAKPSGTYVGYRLDDIYYLDSKNHAISEMEIEPKQCFGDSWLYHKNNDEDKPMLETIASLFMAKSIRSIPMPQAYRAGDKYICTDGNHRLYAAFLRGSNIVVDCYTDKLQGFYVNGEKVEAD